MNNTFNNIAIVVYSCDKNDEVWPIYISCLDKYWENHPKVYLLNETKKYDKIPTITYNYDLELWTKRIRQSLKDISEKYIIFMCDDCFLNSNINLEKLKRCINILDNTKYSNIQFEISTDSNDKISIFPGFKEKTKYSTYVISLLCRIWKKDALIDILKDDSNPWMVEYNQKYGNHKFLQVTDEKVISWFNDQIGGNGAIRYGKWQHGIEDFLKKENIEVDFSKKGFN